MSWKRWQYEALEFGEMFNGVMYKHHHWAIYNTNKGCLVREDGEVLKYNTHSSAMTDIKYSDFQDALEAHKIHAL